MSLLTVAPYDPWKQTAWVGDLIRLSSQMNEDRARRAQQQRQQDLQDQRRAFEFDRRMEFERARTAADDTRADSRLAMEKQILTEDRAPFTVPDLSSSIGAPAAPSGGLAPLPTLEAPQSSAPSVDGLNTDPAASLPETSAPAPGGDEDLFSLDPVSGNPTLVHAGKGTSGAAMGVDPARQIAAPAASPAASLPSLSGGTSTDLFPVGGVPAPSGASPASHAAALAKELAATGLFTRKQAGNILSQAAASEAARRPAAAATRPTVRNFADGTTQQFMGNDASGAPVWKKLAEKNSGEAESLADVVGTSTYNKDHGTYVRDDGSEFFPAKSANGKWTVKPFVPSQKPAKLLWGDDGNVYPVDAQGGLLKPKPEGVQLRDHAALQTVDVQGKGRMVVNPDQTTRILIPEGVALTAKQRDKYTEDAQALRAAQVDLDAQMKLKAENPSRVGVSWFGGGTQSAVDDAQKKFDAARKQVEGWQADFPQLAAKNMPDQPSGKELDPSTAKTILQEAGGDKERARALAKQRGYSF